MAKEEKQPTWLSPVVAELHAEPGLEAAWLFGSFATGRARPGSDVDLAVRLAADAPAREAAAYLELLGRLGLLCGHDVHLIDLGEAPLALRMQVLRHGVLLFDLAPARGRAEAARTLIAWFDWEPARRLLARSPERQLAATGGSGG